MSKLNMPSIRNQHCEVRQIKIPLASQKLYPQAYRERSGP